MTRLPKWDNEEVLDKLPYSVPRPDHEDKEEPVLRCLTCSDETDESAYSVRLQSDERRRSRDSLLAWNMSDWITYIMEGARSA